MSVWSFRYKVRENLVVLEMLVVVMMMYVMYVPVIWKYSCGPLIFLGLPLVTFAPFTLKMLF